MDAEQIIHAAYLRQYDHAVFGKDFFPDHVHLDVEGYRLLGLGLLEQLIDQGVVQPAASWNKATITAISEQVVAGLDKNAQGEALLNLGRVLDWAGKFEEAKRLINQQIELLGPNTIALTLIAKMVYRQGKLDEAISYSEKVLAIWPLTRWG